MKTHMASFDAPQIFPQDVTALCGAEIEQAKAVLEFELESGSLTVRNTIHICRVCWALVGASVDKRTWVYGVLKAADADRLNAKKEEEE